MRQTEPTRIAVGERIEWTRTFDGYSADLYDLQYRFRGEHGPGINVNGTADGAAFIAEITAAQSATLCTGQYHWQAWITEAADATNTFKAAEGVIAVDPGFSVTPEDTIDVRSTAKKILDALDAMMLGRASSDQLEYEIETPAGRRRIKRMTRRELLEMRSYYAGIVSRENASARVRNGGRFGTQVVVNVRER